MARAMPGMSDTASFRDNTSRMSALDARTSRTTLSARMPAGSRPTPACMTLTSPISDEADSSCSAATTPGQRAVLVWLLMSSTEGSTRRP